MHVTMLRQLNLCTSPYKKCQRRPRRREMVYMAEKKSQASYEQIMAIIKNDQVRFVNLEFIDVVGITKCVTIPVEQFANCIQHGKWFDGSALESFARVAESDMYLFPDLDTFAIPGAGMRPETMSQPEQGEAAGQSSDEDVVARVICNVRTP